MMDTVTNDECGIHNPLSTNRVTKGPEKDKVKKNRQDKHPQIARKPPSIILLRNARANEAEYPLGGVIRHLRTRDCIQYVVCWYEN